MQNLKIDIISDVVCPWCIVGYLKLKTALDEIQQQTELEVDISWHPFELAPDLNENGENLREFLSKKYGASSAGGEAARKQLTDIGAELGFEFNFTPQMLRYNTFKAHQLLAWAQLKGDQTALKLALFKGYFTDHLDISDELVLANIAESVGFGHADALKALQGRVYEQSVREEQQLWINQGINSVPSVVLQEKYLVPGALDAQAWQKTIKQVLSEQN